MIIKFIGKHNIICISGYICNWDIYFLILVYDTTEYPGSFVRLLGRYIMHYITNGSFKQKYLRTKPHH